MESNSKKTDINGIYCFVGDEKYQINELKQKLIRELSLTKEDMNLVFLSGNNTTLEEVKNVSLTAPFFAEKKLVVLENTSIVQRYVDDIENVFDILPNTTVLLIIEDSIDARQKSYKILKKYAKLYELKQGNVENKRKLLEIILNENNRTMEPKAKAYLIENSDNDLYSLYNNINKLINYNEDKHITYKDTEKIIMPLISNRVFDMLDSIILSDKEKCIKLYKDLMLLKEDQFKILILLERHIKIMLELSECSGNDKEVASKMHMHEFVVKKTRKLLNNVDKKFLVRALEDCVELEVAIKNGSVNKNIGVDCLLIKLLIEKSKK